MVTRRRKSLARRFAVSVAILAIAALAAAPSAGASGASLVRDIFPGDISPGLGHSSQPIYLTSVNGTLFFVADDGIHGYELWRSDGTAAGTRLVRDIYPGSGGNGSDPTPRDLTNVAGTLYFYADDGVHGYELWRSDGTAAGTQTVRDIVPGRQSSRPIYGGLGLTNVAGTLFFVANDHTHGRELWRSDGTRKGTRLVRDIVPGSEGSRANTACFESVGGTLYFPARDRAHGHELWRSDGTAEGTKMVRDIRPGSGSSEPCYLTNVRGKPFFVADDGTHGAELWRSDGTREGTQLVRDILPGRMFSVFGELTNVRGTLFFTYWDYVVTDETQLWRSDGTGTGTRLVRGGLAGTSDLTAVGETLFFFGTEGGTDHLWTSDGTRETTKAIHSFVDDGRGSAAGLVSVAGTLYFSADDGVHGYELWRSDGTRAGTRLVSDIRPGRDDSGYPNGSDPGSLTEVDGMLFFSAFDGTHGQELWKAAP